MSTNVEGCLILLIIKLLQQYLFRSYTQEKEDGIDFTYPTKPVLATQSRFLAASNIYFVITAKNVARWASPRSPPILATE